MFAGIFYYFWRDLQKRQAAELLKQKQREEAQAKREAEYARVRREVRSLPKARTRSLPRTPQPPVATPRQAAPSPSKGKGQELSQAKAPSPTRRVVERTTTSTYHTEAPASSPAPDNSLEFTLLGAAIGASLSDDRPSQSCSVSTDSTPFSSGGGGDYGGGGAESSWSDPSPSSSSDSYSSSDSPSSSSFD